MKKLKFWLDECIELPHGIKIGFDPIIGLIPGIGDFLSSLFYIITLKHAQKLNVPNSIIMQMTLNTIIDFMIGLVPIIGDLLDISYKAHSRNAEILIKYIDRPAPVSRGSKLIVFLAMLIPIGLMILSLYGLYLLTVFCLNLL